MFLTNNFTLLTASIYPLPKVGWQAAMKSLILIAVSVYVLAAIVKKRLNLDALLHTLLQIIIVTFTWKMPLLQACPAATTKEYRATTVIKQIDSRFNWTLLIWNSVRLQIVFLIPAHWVELQLVDYCWQ